LSSCSLSELNLDLFSISTVVACPMLVSFCSALIRMKIVCSSCNGGLKKNSEMNESQFCTQSLQNSKNVSQICYTNKLLLGIPLILRVYLQ